MFAQEFFHLLPASELGGSSSSQSTRYETLFDMAGRSWSFWPENEVPETLDHLLLILAIDIVHVVVGHLL